MGVSVREVSVQGDLCLGGGLYQKDTCENITLSQTSFAGGNYAP